MSNKSKIEWTDRTWNPVTGCSKISEGCMNCYAERMSKRLKAMKCKAYEDGFSVRCHPDVLDKPMRWRQPSKVFVCSMGDLFHEDVPFDFIAAIFGVMGSEAGRRHKYQILTKRPGRMLEFFEWVNRFGKAWILCRSKMKMKLTCLSVPHDRYDCNTPEPWPLPNVWIGVTAESQEQADVRIPKLLEVPAVIRFVSVEPMLGPVDLHRHLSCWIPPTREDPGGGYYHGIDWIVCGGESGPNARPMDPDWVRNLRDDCIAKEVDVAFFFKQWGGKNKKQAGRLIDGQEWLQWPEGS